MNRFVLQAQKYFPRCLSSHHSTPRKVLPPSWKDSEDDFVISFDIHCRCGSKHLKVLGIPDEELGLYSPIQTRCLACANEELLFDVTKHGHDVELGEGSSYSPREGDLRALECKKCRNTGYSVIPWFTYQFEEDDLSDVPSEDVANYFDVFGLDLICSKCKAVQYIGSYECA